MKRVVRYGFFQNMNPICPERIRQYPEQEPITRTTLILTDNHEDGQKDDRT